MSWKQPDRRSTRPQPISGDGIAAHRPRSTTVSLDARRILEGFELDSTLLPGARNVVSGHLCVAPRSHVTLLCDAGEEALGRAMLEALTEIDAVTTIYLLAHRLPESDGAANRVASTLATSDAAIYVFAETPPHDSARARWLAAGRGSRQALLAGVSPTVARQSLRANPEEVARLGKSVAARLGATSTLEISTSTGTKLTVRTGLGSGILVEDGSIGESQPVPRFPTGEVFVACHDVEGQLVADGGLWLDAQTMLGQTSRIVLTFAEGRLASARGADSERLVAFLEEMRISRTVAAVGFGTNPNVLTPVRELAQDARMPGLHLVLGRLRDLDDVTSPRVDVLARRPDVLCDGDAFMVNGRYARSIAE